MVGHVTGMMPGDGVPQDGQALAGQGERESAVHLGGQPVAVLAAPKSCLASSIAVSYRRQVIAAACTVAVGAVTVQGHQDKHGRAAEDGQGRQPVPFDAGTAAITSARPRPPAPQRAWEKNRCAR